MAKVNHSGVFVRLISETRDFIYGPAMGQQREIVFQSNKEIVDEGPDPLDGWTVAFNGKHKEHELHVYSEGKVISIMRLHPRGYWEGKDFRHKRGTSRITPKELKLKKWDEAAKTPPVEIPDNSDAGVIDAAFDHMLGERLPHRPEALSFNLADSLGKFTENTAIALIGYDRPNYFKEVLATLATNPEFYKYPIFVFLDKTPDPAMGDAHVQLLHNLGITPAAIIRRPHNYGCGRNIIDVRRQLFDNLGFDRVFVFEDDMMVTPEYMKLCENMMDWAEDNYDNIGVVQAWELCKHDISYKKLNLESVFATFSNLWGYLMTRTCWDRIKEYLYRYEHLFLSGPYGERNHELIRKWLFQQLKLFTQNNIEGIHYPTTEQYVINKDRELTFPVSGQDGVTMTAIYLSGQMRLTTRVNRGYYIGETGIHQSPERYKMAGFHMMALDAFESDRDLTEFAAGKNDMGEVISGLRYVKEA